MNKATAVPGLQPGPTQPGNPGRRCLLCDSQELRPVWRLHGHEVRQLWRAAGHVISETAYGQVRPETPVELAECVACGFRFFDPALAGGGGFYEDLEKSEYYAPHRPEFDFAFRLCRQEGSRRILDVGGGEGAFLDRTRSAGMETYGVELNAQAADISSQKGHHITRKRLEEISVDELGGAMDMVTLFHVIEHVPDPRGFFSAAKNLVRPGGLLVVSVPNDRGLRRLMPFDPGNVPPHHISRWRRDDLRRLGATANMQCVAEDADPLYGSEISRFWLLHNRLAQAIGRPSRFGGGWLPQTLSFCYRKLGGRHYFPHWGLNLYAAYRKP